MAAMAVRDEFITLNGLRFHYRDWGDPAAPPLLLLHGALCHAHMFDSLAARMSDRYRVLALDQRGHGETDWASDYQHARVAEDGAAFIAALGLGRVALVGFSFGGDTALAFAAAQPGRVTRLVLYETAVTDAPAPRTREALLRWRGVPALVDDPDEAERLLREQIPRAAQGELRAFVRAGLRQQADGRWAWRWDPAFRIPGPPGRLAMVPADFWRALTLVACPTLVLRGAETAFIMTPEVAARMVAALPHGHLATIPAAGHFAWLDNPEAFMATIRDFLLAD